jgi:hypothetical protein
MIGGSWAGGVGGKDGEKLAPGGEWAVLPEAPVARILTADPAGEYRSDNHAWLFAWSGAEGTSALRFDIMGLLFQISLILSGDLKTRALAPSGYCSKYYSKAHTAAQSNRRNDKRLRALKEFLVSATVSLCLQLWHQSVLLTCMLAAICIACDAQAIAYLHAC